MSKYAVSLLLIASLAALPAVAFADVPTSANAPAAKDSLADALGGWIAALEADDAKTAAKWAADAKVAEEMTRHWAGLKENQKKFDYRKWLKTPPDGESIEQGATAGRFKVGGHNYGHLHIDWVRNGEQWQIVKMWMCR